MITSRNMMSMALTMSFLTTSFILEMVLIEMIRNKGRKTKACLCQNQLGSSKTCYALSNGANAVDKRTPNTQNAWIFLSLLLKTGLKK